MPRPKSGKQNRREKELRGFKYKEPSVVASFWIRYKMEEVEHLTPEELDAFIDKFYEVYEKDQIKGNPLFQYNLDPLSLDKKYRKQYNKEHGI